MRDEVPKESSLGRFIDRVRAWILGFVAVVSGLYGIIKLIQGDVGLVSILCVIVAIAVLLLVSLYGYFKKASFLKAAGFINKDAPRKYQYSRRIRQFAFAGIIAVTF